MQKTILVVDDDANMVDLLNLTLQEAGYAVVTAADGVTALKKARSLSPDLILLDLVLPEMDGFSVCETLRRERSTAQLPIVMLTGLTSVLNRYAGIGSGANAYLNKPITPDEIITTVKSLIGEPGQLTLLPPDAASPRLHRNASES
jgi:two-component system, OmpR family, response regulator RpaA